MDKENNIDILYFILSGVFAFFLYSLIILFILFLLKNSIPISISINNPSSISSISVNLIDEIPQQLEKPNTSTLKSSSIDGTKNSSGSKTPIAGIGAGDLFKKIDTNNPKPRDSNLADNRDKIAVNKKDSGKNNPTNEKLSKILGETQNIMQTLEGVNQNITISDSTNSKFCEKYRDYCNKIAELLYKNWDIKSGFDYTLMSVVMIKISKDGNFGYTIKKKSGNTEFDNELESSLAKLTNTKFPTIENINIDNLEVIFKNKKGDE